MIPARTRVPVPTSESITVHGRTIPAGSEPTTIPQGRCRSRHRGEYRTRYRHLDRRGAGAHALVLRRVSRTAREPALAHPRRARHRARHLELAPAPPRSEPPHPPRRCTGRPRGFLPRRAQARDRPPARHRLPPHPDGLLALHPRAAPLPPLDREALPHRRQVGRTAARPRLGRPGPRARSPRRLRFGRRQRDRHAPRARRRQRHTAAGDAHASAQGLRRPRRTRPSTCCRVIAG